MADDQNQNANGGGAAGGNKDGGGGAETVAKADHDRALADLHKFKSEAKAKETELADLKARLEAIETEKKTSTGDFKSLYEQSQSSANEWKSKYEGLKGSMVITEKHKAATAALVKAGIHAEALSMLDHEKFEGMEVEATSQGRFIVHGADLFAESFKKKYAFAFGKGAPPVVNAGGGSGGGSEGGDLNPTRLFEIEQECKKKGDMKPYREAVTRYMEQKRKAN